MHSPVSKISSLLAVAFLFNAVVLVPVQADAQASAPACTDGKGCRKKPQPQRPSVAVNAAPGDQAPAGKTGAVKVNAAPGDQPSAKQKGAVQVNTPPADQPGVHRVSSKASAARVSVSKSVSVGNGRRGNQPTCVGVNCPSVPVNSADNPKK